MKSSTFLLNKQSRNAKNSKLGSRQMSESNEDSFQKKEMDVESIKKNQNLTMGALAGIVASLIGAAIWAAVTLITEYQIGFMAIGIGFLVGYAIRYFGKGIDSIFSIMGAAFSLLGCVLGNFITIMVIIHVKESIPIFQLLGNLDFSIIFSLMKETFQAMDLLFYGIALYEGYKLSIIPKDTFDERNPHPSES